MTKTQPVGENYEADSKLHKWVPSPKKFTWSLNHYFLNECSILVHLKLLVAGILFITLSLEICGSLKNKTQKSSLLLEVQTHHVLILIGPYQDSEYYT